VGAFVVRNNGGKSGKVTIIDVAQEAGVSYSTVSRVATNYEHVSPETRQRVLAAMDKLGYVANQHARSLHTGRSQVVGLLVHGLGSEYMAEIFRGVEEEIAAANYDLMLYTTHRHIGREAQYVANITRGFADGLLLVVPIGRENYLEALRRASFPHVIVDEDKPDGLSPSVGITNYKGTYDATRYLLDLGHRRIGFITDRMGLTTAVARLEGYQQALADAGVPYDPDLVQEEDFMRPRTPDSTRRLLALAQPATAILTSSDPIAFRAIEVLRQDGLRVPDDVSVVGFDDIPQASLTFPRLTTVRHPMYDMGRAATRMLLERIQDPYLPPRHIQLETELVIRESCRAARA
jgi:LacI family transcriptional regulator